MTVFSRYALLLERLGLAAVLIGLTYFLIRTDIVWRWDQVIYDAQLKYWSRSPPDDIVIVAVDADSLAALGAWPWPRQHHAQLVRILTQAAPRAILLDIIFAEPLSDHPEGDQALAEAIRDSGRVILPILAEQSQQWAPLTETRPLPALASGASGLGHIHFELDSDGMARSVYLLAGLGSPAWPTFGLTALRFLEPDRWTNLPGVRDPDTSPVPPSVWVQDYRVLVPFVGPPGSFRRVSYHRILRGEVAPEVFRNKIVLVGATVSGLSDALPTPVSGFNQPMPGVEIHATVIDALREGLTIEPMAYSWRVGLSLAFVVFPALIFPHFSPRNALLAAAGLLLLTAGASLFLLRGVHLWFPPVAVLIALALGYPLWSWRRLEYTMRYLNRELETLYNEPTVLTLSREPDIGGTISFIRQFMPIDGWVLQAVGGARVAGGGIVPDVPPRKVLAPTWLSHGDSLWVLLSRAEKSFLLGLHWGGDGLPTQQQHSMLNELVRYLSSQANFKPRGAVEMVEARIQQVQGATERLRNMGHLISDSLAEMADGVLIANAFGQIVLANERAVSYLSAKSEADWVGRSLPEVLRALELPESLSWNQVLAGVLFQGTTAQFYTRQHERDLLVQIAHLSLGSDHPSGVIINITDITLLKASERRRLELLGFLSHDLRSPLVSILALTELARARQSENPIFEDFVSRVENYARHILDLADDFLNLVRAESTEEIPLRQVELVAIAQNALDKVWPQAHQKNIALRGDFEVEQAWTLGSPDLLERACVNLLTNAVKYSPPNTKVELCITRHDAVIACWVKDQGYGISADELPHIFESFRRAGGPYQGVEAGLGLGLAFVKVVAERHGGCVTVSSEPGKGSSFCLTLPAAGNSHDPEHRMDLGTESPPVSPR